MVVMTSESEKPDVRCVMGGAGIRLTNHAVYCTQLCGGVYSLPLDRHAIVSLPLTTLPPGLDFTVETLKTTTI